MFHTDNMPKQTHTNPAPLTTPRLPPFLDADTLSSPVLCWFNSLLFSSLRLPFTPLRDLWLNGFASLFPHRFPKGCDPSICNKMRGLFNLAETDTSAQSGGVFMRHCRRRMPRTHTEQTHVDHMRPRHATHSLPFMTGASIQKLRTQLAPAQSSQADQASCYTGGVALRKAPAEPTEPEHTHIHTHSLTPGVNGEKLEMPYSYTHHTLKDTELSNWRACTFKNDSSLHEVCLSFDLKRSVSITHWSLVSSLGEHHCTCERSCTKPFVAPEWAVQRLKNGLMWRYLRQGRVGLQPEKSVGVELERSQHLCLRLIVQKHYISC